MIFCFIFCLCFIIIQIEVKKQTFILRKDLQFMNERRNRRLMQLVRHVHGLMDIDDTQKNRDSQDHLGSLYANDKKFIFTDNNPHNMHGEWTHFISDKESADNADDTVIFYCHGGGYMTGSCLYARSLTMKLAKYTHHDVFCFDYRPAPEHP